MKKGCEGWRIEEQRKGRGGRPPIVQFASVPPGHCNQALQLQGGRAYSQTSQPEAPRSQVQAPQSQIQGNMTQLYMAADPPRPPQATVTPTSIRSNTTPTSLPRAIPSYMRNQKVKWGSTNQRCCALTKTFLQTLTSYYWDSET